MAEQQNLSTKDIFKTKHQHTLHTEFSSMTTANNKQKLHKTYTAVKVTT